MIKDRKKDMPYTEGIRTKFLDAVTKIEAPPNVTAEILTGFRLAKEEAIKVMDKLDI